MSFKKWIAKLVVEGLQELEEEENEQCEGCGHVCDACKEKQQIGYPHEAEEQEDGPVDDPTPPSRYCVRANGLDYWVDDIKPDPILGWNLRWNQTINGEVRNVVCTIYDVGVVIVDYESPMTKETFENIKKQSFEYAMQLAQSKEDAVKKKKAEEEQQIAPAKNAIYASYS